MRQKKPKPWDEFAQARRDRERSSPKVSQLYPHVQEIRIWLRFTPHDGPPTPVDRTKIWKSDDDAFFEIECLDRECICGGFDLAPVVDEAVKNRQTDVEGRLSCEGWQDSERYRKNRCMIALDYRVSPTHRSS
jgi:hypothetical protein